jgi:hypothetical protein
MKLPTAVVLAACVGCSSSDASPAPGALSGTDAAPEDVLMSDARWDTAAPHDAAARDAPDEQAPDAQTFPCSPPPGNLLAHGTFEEGMQGLAPTGWEVRNPAMPEGACLASGSPEQHVFLSEAPPGCQGHALSIDARGEWDCYAIQRVSDYGSIQGGARYRVQALVRSQGNAPDGAYCPECAAAWFVIGVQWLDANDSFFGDEKNIKPADPSQNDHDWSLVSFDLEPPPNATRILVWLTAHYPGRVDYDNVAVLPL